MSNLDGGTSVMRRLQYLHFYEAIETPSNRPFISVIAMDANADLRA
jgi:hypothetical protein